MRSGNPLLNLWSHRTNLGIASYFVSISITCLAAAFALAAYVVLAPVAQNTCPHLSRTAIQSTGVHRDMSYSPETLMYKEGANPGMGIFSAYYHGCYVISVLALHNYLRFCLVSEPVSKNRSTSIGTSTSTIGINLKLAGVNKYICGHSRHGMNQYHSCHLMDLE